MSRLNFTLDATASGTNARATTFRTLHNEVQTPVFMPVGTHANVRGQRFETLRNLGYPVLLANTYHLMLRPGPEVFERLGGIQKFMGWERSVLTDSGGFQIFSLPNERVISEEGALFKNYINDQTVLLTPEKSIEVQKSIGSDIMMVLDQCIPSTANRAEAEAAMHLTHRWAKRSYKARGDSPQSLFAIVQGALFPDLRKISAEVLTALPFDGFAIGGLAVGETKSEREDMCEFTAQLLPVDRPRYLMGVGTPLDILEAVHRGVDMFDCILPGALGQQGVAFTERGKIDLRRGLYKFVDERIDEDCPCTACREHSIAYLHHLIRGKELLGGILVTAHNLTFYAKLMKEIRQSILENRFRALYDEKREHLQRSDRKFPVTILKPRKNPMHLSLGDYEIHQSRPEIFSIRHVPSGEIMHSSNDPNEEARTLYIEQSGFSERITEVTDRPLVIWDVGLGAAINAMAAVSTYEKAQATRPVHLVSFENDLNSLRLALKKPSVFAHLRHAAPVKLLAEHTWTSKSGTFTWTLHEGDFRNKIFEAAVPDLIFFDPFSPKTDSEAWTFECFKEVFRRCGAHETELFTYSSSTAVRASLLAAGFFVARGVATGPREETTVALTPGAVRAPRHAILPPQWLDRWERSSAKFPPSVPADYHPQFEAAIRSHPQFSI
jgi:queuine tRNA-ribosyltransferase